MVKINKADKAASGELAQEKGDGLTTCDQQRCLDSIELCQWVLSIANVFLMDRAESWLCSLLARKCPWISNRGFHLRRNCRCMPLICANVEQMSLAYSFKQPHGSVLRSFKAVAKKLEHWGNSADHDYICFPLYSQQNKIWFPVFSDTFSFVGWNLDCFLLWKVLVKLSLPVDIYENCWKVSF